MEGIAGEVTGCGERVFHEPRRMERADGFVVGDTGRDDFATAGIASHEVRFHQPCCDLHIRLNEQAVQADGAVVFLGVADVNNAVFVAGVVVLHAHVFQHPGVAHQLSQFIAQVGTVEAGCDQYRDAR